MVLFLFLSIALIFWQWIWPTIFIQPRCYRCSFRDYILDHERFHLEGVSDEYEVEELNLNKNGIVLIRMLLSNTFTPCLDCPFRKYQLIARKTAEYLRREKLHRWFHYIWFQISCEANIMSGCMGAIRIRNAIVHEGRLSVSEKEAKNAIYNIRSFYLHVVPL